jgi:hypothetical protein
MPEKNYNPDYPTNIIKHYLNVPKIIRIQRERYIQETNRAHDPRFGCTENDSKKFLHTTISNLPYRESEISPFTCLLIGRVRQFRFVVGLEIENRLKARNEFLIRCKESRTNYKRRN